MHLLGEHGVLVVEREVLTIKGRSRPGELARVAKALADHKINIEYAYSATPPDASKGSMILRVDNTAKAKQVLRGY